MSLRAPLSLALLSTLTLVGTGCKKGENEAKAAEAETAAKTTEANAELEAKKMELLASKRQGTGAHSNGMKRFKEPGVYVDGKPIGIISFAELPVPMPVNWHEERAAVPFKAGSDEPRFKIVKQRRYRFRDYFVAMGVDIEKITEVHLYGGNKKAAAVVISGDELRNLEGFQFRFGGDVYGKPLPSCPTEIKDGKCPDQISTVTAYIDKKPPTRHGGYFYLDDKLVEDIPYFGKAIRGGVRVYKDGPIATTIKRNKLLNSDIKPTGPEGSERWPLFAFFKSQGVETDDIKEAWIIHKGRRVKRLKREELVEATFRAEQGKSGLILLGDDDIPVNALALHTRELALSELPDITDKEFEFFND